MSNFSIAVSFEEKWLIYYNLLIASGYMDTPNRLVFILLFGRPKFRLKRLQGLLYQKSSKGAHMSFMDERNKCINSAICDMCSWCMILLMTLMGRV